MTNTCQLRVPLPCTAFDFRAMRPLTGHRVDFGARVRGEKKVLQLLAALSQWGRKRQPRAEQQQQQRNALVSLFCPPVRVWCVCARRRRLPCSFLSLSVFFLLRQGSSLLPLCAAHRSRSAAGQQPQHQTEGGKGRARIHSAHTRQHSAHFACIVPRPLVSYSSFPATCATRIHSPFIAPLSLPPCRRRRTLSW